MKRPVCYFNRLLVPLFMLAGVIATSAIAQDKAKVKQAEPTTKVLYDEKLLVVEVTYKPGDESASSIHPYRVEQPLKSGTIRRIYSDGKTENLAINAGDMTVYEADKTPFATRNVGTTDLIFYVVALGQPEKLPLDQFVNEREISP